MANVSAHGDAFIDNKLLDFELVSTCIFPLLQKWSEQERIKELKTQEKLHFESIRFKENMDNIKSKKEVLRYCDGIFPLNSWESRHSQPLQPVELEQPPDIVFVHGLGGSAFKV